MDQATIDRSATTVPAYSTVSKWFHWITTTLLLAALPLGLVIEHVKEADQGAFYMLHQSLGLTILVVVVARLLWRQMNPPPPAPHIPRVWYRAANFVHLALYTLLIVQPVLGFLASNANGYPLQGETALFGVVELPTFTEKNEAVGAGLQNAHNVIGFAILALVILHIAAVVFHQAIRRDNTLLRMV